MADETKLKAQATEFVKRHIRTLPLSTQLRISMEERDEAVMLCTTFARQVADALVKAETADLRDRLARYEAMIGQAYRIEFTDWERVIEKSGSYTSKTGIVWRIEDEDGNKFSLHETALEAFEQIQENK